MSRLTASLKTAAYVNGQWLTSSKNFSVVDPATLKPIAKVSSFGADQYNTAIESAHEAFLAFKKTGRERANLLDKMYRLMSQNHHDLAKLIVLENGKPYADAAAEVLYAASFFQWFSEEAAHFSGSLIQSLIAANRIFAIKQPIGVCGIVTPWNFPSAMITRKLAAALAAGCTAVIKPASETPLSALALADLAEQAGFPSGVVNVVPLDDAAGAGQAITEHPLVKKVSFTGSTNVGKILMLQALKTVKKCSFELGGNAPFIVFADADIDAAVAGVMASKFRSSGQTCVCANRVFVQREVYAQFAEKLVAAVEKTVLGHGLDKQTTHGPLIHERSLQKVQQHVRDATEKGAEVLVGGKHRPDIGPLFHDLTVLGNVTPEMQVFSEETFGPVCPLISFSTEEEVIQLANQTEVGLAGYFYTTNVSKTFRVAEALEVGMVGVNTGAISEAALPFGGVKESGFGREGSKYGIDDYTVVKSIVLAT